MPVNDSSFSTSIPLSTLCLLSRPSSYIFISYSITKIVLLLPLYIVILCYRLQQWWKKRSTSSATTVSPSDSFIYHMATMELIGIIGCLICCFGIYKQDLIILLVGTFINYFRWYGQTFFHILACLERYLAVVYPIVYLDLKNERGIRMRNTTIGCVWVLCVAGAGSVMKENIFIIVHLCLNILSIIPISFCSLSVLCVLTRPGPGERGTDKTDQSKRRAFYTILYILGMLLLKFASSVLWTVIYGFGGSNCVIMTSFVWLYFLFSIVLHVLLLKRLGNSVFCKNNIH